MDGGAWKAAVHGVAKTERLYLHFSLSRIGEENGNPLQCSCLENPRDRGAWWAAVYGVAQSWTRLKWLSSSSSSSSSSSNLLFCIFYFRYWYYRNTFEIIRIISPRSSVFCFSPGINERCPFRRFPFFVTIRNIYLAISWFVAFHWLNNAQKMDSREYYFLDSKRKIFYLPSAIFQALIQI